MNNHHNNGENDKSLHADLDRLSSSYARLEQDEPPELLDLAILNRAHRAVEKRPHRMKFSWLHGLTTTAVFVLAFSLILNQPESTPILLDGVDENQTTGLERDREIKKRDQDPESSETIPKGAGQLNVPQETPAAAAPMRGAVESESEGRVRQSASEAQPSMYVKESRKEKLEVPLKDAEISGALPEETQGDVAEPVVDALKVEATFGESKPMTAVETVEEEAEIQFDADLEIEQELQAILALKQAGNSQWKTELESFRELHPDYPLPDELAEQVP